jgi:hypothetical protein
MAPGHVYGLDEGSGHPTLSAMRLRKGWGTRLVVVRMGSWYPTLSAMSLRKGWGTELFCFYPQLQWAEEQAISGRAAGPAR